MADDCAIHGSYAGGRYFSPCILAWNQLYTMGAEGPGTTLRRPGQFQGHPDKLRVLEGHVDNDDHRRLGCDHRVLLRAGACASHGRPCEGKTLFPGPAYSPGHDGSRSCRLYVAYALASRIRTDQSGPRMVCRPPGDYLLAYKTEDGFCSPYRHRILAVDPVHVSCPACRPVICQSGTGGGRFNRRGLEMADFLENNDPGHQSRGHGCHPDPDYRSIEDF